MFQVQERRSPKKWEEVRFCEPFSTFEAAKECARGLDQDGCLINFRVVNLTNGSIVTFKVGD